MATRATARLPPEVNRILYVKNLPYKISAEEMYDLFDKYGDIRQIRIGNTKETRGTAFVIYEDIYDAKRAYDTLSGFKVADKYLVIIYFKANKILKEKDLEKREKELEEYKMKYGLSR
ncbi:hypothetical protein WA158_006513 [Blastocystis sp. Blastoise]